jgi:hypothetical protein
MSLTLQLPITIEEQLKRDAAQEGVSMERYILQLLTQNFVKKAAKKTRKSLTETELLKRIALQVAPDDLEEFHHLKSLFKAENITEIERERLIQLNEIIEIAHAERLKYVLLLANFRGETFDKTLQTLGIQSSSL